MNKVTLWHKIFRNDEGEITKIEFNHLDDGWKEENKPLPKSNQYSNQVAWQNEEWSKQYKLITDKNVVVNSI